MPAGTVQLHRVLRSTPERIYRAFLDADAMAKWLPPYGFYLQGPPVGCHRGRHVQDVVYQFHYGRQSRVWWRVSGTRPVRKDCYTDKFDDQSMPGEMRTTVTLKPVLCGTDISVVQEGIPEAIPTEMCYLDWQESLAQLAHLVEPEIPA